MKKAFLFILFICHLIFCGDLPPKSVLQNMTYDEKLDLYNSKKITLLKNMLPHTGLPLLQRQKKMIINGYAISGSIFMYGLLTKNEELGGILPVLGFAGVYATSIIVHIDKEKQRRLYNDELYEEIFLISP